MSALNPTSPTVLELHSVFKLITYSYEPPVTEESKANKQYTQIVQPLNELKINITQSVSLMTTLFQLA
jgi:hypothetical protein